MRMLKELFEAHFYGTFPKVDNKVLMLEERTATGDFSLNDPKACLRCKYVCNEEPEQREQLKVQTNDNVCIISIDQVFSFVREEVGDICDYMIETTNSTIFVEMSCSTTEYVPAKRIKARSQLYNTLEKLFTCPPVRAHIEKKNKHYVVFSWKETPNIKDKMDNVESNMMDMTLLSDAIYSPYNESKFAFDFKLKEIRYPDPFIC